MVEPKEKIEDSKETINILANISAGIITFLGEKKGLSLSDINTVLDIGKTIVMEDLLLLDDLEEGDEVGEPDEPELEEPTKQ